MYYLKNKKCQWGSTGVFIQQLSYSSFAKNGMKRELGLVNVEPSGLVVVYSEDVHTKIFWL